MSIIHVRQIQSHLESEIIPGISELKESSKLDKDSLLSRALAAFSIQILAHIDLESAIGSITDGSDDNGIDAIYVDEANSRLYLAQSKWIHSGNGEPDLSSIKKFTGGIVDLINLKFNKFNNKIQNKAVEIQTALENPSFKMTIVLAYPGINGPAKHAITELNELLDSLNDANEIVELQVIKQTQLHRGLLVENGPNISIDISITSWGKIREPYAAWYGQVTGSQIYKWWNDHHEQLFSKNLRGVLTDTDINIEIRNSLINSPQYFWYFNNGITLVAEKIKKPLAHAGANDLAILSCSNISIVNGAQTVGTIGRYSSNPTSELERVTVPIRIIEIDSNDNDFGKNITRANNRQNRIENRDFVALDPEQTRLQEELSVDGFSYQLLRAESFVPSTKSFDVVEATTSLACATGDGGLAVQLKREISKLWEDLDRTPYKRLFNSSITGLYLSRCVLAQRMIDQVITVLSRSSSSTPELTGVLVHGNRIISALILIDLKSTKFNDQDYQFKKEITTAKIKKLCINYSTKLHKGIEEYFPKTPLPTLFKNTKKCYELIQVCQDDNSKSLKQISLNFIYPDEDD